MYKIINQNNVKYQGESKLFAHYSKFLINPLLKNSEKHDADTSFRGHKVMMLEIEAYVQKPLSTTKKQTTTI